MIFNKSPIYIKIKTTYIKEITATKGGKLSVLFVKEILATQNNSTFLCGWW